MWDFWIDRGGTFTDIVARDPAGALRRAKLLSEGPDRRDAALSGIRRFLGLGPDDPIPAARVRAVKMGTTVATNALLERKGEPVVLVTTQGLGQQLRLAYQNRPKLFARHIVLPEMLYARVIEARERVRADGTVEVPLDAAHLAEALGRARAEGLSACAIVFVHGYRHRAHEAEAARIARAAGFGQVSVSHEVSPLMKMVSRGDTTVADAYLSPILRRYVDRVAAAFDGDMGGKLMFMQSSGGLTDARRFQGKDAVLSGPAGGVVGAALVIDSASVEAIGEAADLVEPELPLAKRPESEQETALTAPVFLDGGWREARFVKREALRPGDRVTGPAVVVEPHTAILVASGWRAEVTAHDHMLLTRIEARPKREAAGTHADPVLLEVFNNLYMSIAEQMGAVLENTAASVTIKERLDFSCAVFDRHGDLIANAPHMPVHLGSMGASVKAILAANPDMGPGDVYALNAPYAGGTHLPDITVVMPVWGAEGLLFFTAARGHHTDIGGLTPGSMPPDSRTIHDEGVYIENWKLVEAGRFREAETRALLTEGPHPARAPETNLADLRAQVAACAKGAAELDRMVAHFGLEVVQAYMGHVQDNAEECVRRAIQALSDADYVYPMDPDFDGSPREVRVRITVDKAARTATIDFTGTTRQLATNYNAPEPVTRAAVLYVFRCLVDDDIPMNEGVMKPLNVILPRGTMLSPDYPAAVIAGNVETSQAVTSALFLALGVQAAAQSTMNNTTWGDDRRQYYETICGGTGAGRLSDGSGHPGTSGVHSHMTNSRLTDPEVLEWRYPVVLDAFHLREGSGGEGRWRGGEGVVRRIRFLEPMTVAILAGHRILPPPGLGAGGPGAVGRTRLQRADGTVEELASADRREARAGDVYWLETPGGGGYS